jgi:hypothetical protein
MSPNDPDGILELLQPLFVGEGCVDALTTWLTLRRGAVERQLRIRAVEALSDDETRPFALELSGRFKELDYLLRAIEEIIKQLNGGSDGSH